jgi:hypothetical protein
MESGSAVWAGFSVDPRKPASADLRATDADRDHAADVLREAFADGRLNRDEYEARSGTVLGTRKIGDFSALLADLVPSDEVVSAASLSAALRVKAVVRYERELRSARNGWIFVTTLCVAIWAATGLASGGLAFFWPVFPMIGVGIGYFSMRLNREERIEAIEDKESHRPERSSDAD